MSPGLVGSEDSVENVELEFSKLEHSGNAGVSVGLENRVKNGLKKGACYLSVVPGSGHGFDLVSSEVNAELVGSGEEVAPPGGKLVSGKDAILVGVVRLEENLGVGADEGSDSALELILGEGARSVAVDDVPVLDAEVVKVSLCGVLHAEVVGGSSSASGELGAGDFIGAVRVAEVPESVVSVAHGHGRSLEVLWVGGSPAVDLLGRLPPVLDEPCGVGLGESDHGGGDLHFF